MLTVRVCLTLTQCIVRLRSCLFMMNVIPLWPVKSLTLSHRQITNNEDGTLTSSSTFTRLISFQENSVTPLIFFVAKAGSVIFKIYVYICVVLQLIYIFLDLSI